MKKIFSIIMMLATLAMSAQSPQQMLDKAVNAMKGAMSARYTLKSAQGNISGTFDINGSMFRMLSDQVKCWYNGTTQWTYSTATQEVNINTPTQAELSMTNPMAAAQSFKTNFHIWKAAGQIPKHYAIMLKPKNKSDIKQIYLYISEGTNLLHNAHIKMNDGSAFTITLTDIKKSSYSTNIFTFDPSLVPVGTDVVDLR